MKDIQRLYEQLRKFETTKGEVEIRLEGEVQGVYVDNSLAQMACYIAGVLLLCLGFYKLNTMGSALSEIELFYGILQVLAVALLMICLGTLTRIAAMWTHAHAIKLQLEEAEASEASKAEPEQA